MTELEALKSAIRGLHGAKIEGWHERPWASVSFAGRVATAELSFPTVAQGEAFAAEFEEHEFNIPRFLVADAAIIRVETDPEFRVSAEILALSEDGLT